jgi:hypothetical protein
MQMLSLVSQRHGKVVGASSPELQLNDRLGFKRGDISLLEVASDIGFMASVESSLLVNRGLVQALRVGCLQDPNHGYSRSTTSFSMNEMCLGVMRQLFQNLI